MQVLDDGRLQAGFVQLRDVVDLDVGQSLGTVDADEACICVDFAPCKGRSARNTQGRDTAVFAVGDTGKDLEGDILHRLGDVGQFQGDAQIRLVGAVALHCLGVGDARKRVRQVGIYRLLEHGANQLFHQRRDLGLAHERGFHIDLSEFGLAVGTQILVAETLGQLVVAVVAGNHQQLLEKLRRLRQGKELSGMHARRHQIIARTFGRALGQHRRFDIDKASIVKEAAEGACRLVTQHHVALHLRAPQVDHAMQETHILRQVILVELEGRRYRGIQHFDRVTEDFYFTARNVGIHRSLRAGTHLARDLEAELVAHRLGNREHFRTIRIADDLRQALAVAQVDKDDATVVAPTMGPAAESHFLADGL